MAERFSDEKRGYTDVSGRCLANLPTIGIAIVGSSAERQDGPRYRRF